MSGTKTTVVSSFGDVLRTVRPAAFPEATAQVQGAVAAALDWFVVEAPEIAAAHCVGLACPPIPDVLLLLDNVTVETALRPASFRKHVRQLRGAVVVCKNATDEAYDTLPREARRRLYGPGPLATVAAQLDPVMADYVLARGWLSSYGTKAGYWAFQWLHICLHVAAIDSEDSRADLCQKLRESADTRFREYFDDEASAS